MEASQGSGEKGLGRRGGIVNQRSKCYASSLCSAKPRIATQKCINARRGGQRVSVGEFVTGSGVEAIGAAEGRACLYKLVKGERAGKLYEAQFRGSGIHAIANAQKRRSFEWKRADVGARIGQASSFSLRYHAVVRLREMGKAVLEVCQRLWRRVAIAHGFGADGLQAVAG